MYFCALGIGVMRSGWLTPDGNHARLRNFREQRRGDIRRPVILCGVGLYDPIQFVPVAHTHVRFEMYASPPAREKLRGEIGVIVGQGHRRLFDALPVFNRRLPIHRCPSP